MDFWDLENALRHIEALDARRARLETAQGNAEEQFLHRLAQSLDAGAISFDEVYAVYLRLKVLRLQGRATRWNARISPSWSRMEAAGRNRPNGPAGTWVGDVPIGGDECAPPEGTPVVYILFDIANEPCYVGSTDNLRARVKAHLVGGKQFARWQAYGCDTREDAYRLEVRLLNERFPRLNQRRGR